MNELSLIIGADLVPTRSNYELFQDGNITALIGVKLQEIINSTDFSIFNLETPLCDTPSPIKKNGVHLCTPVSTINGIKALNPSLVTLANNHIMDQGVRGYESTIETLKKYEIPFTGAGKDLSSACESFILEKNGCKIGIYACAEHEFSIAGPDDAGANPFDPLESLDHIGRLKSQCDYVVVLYHGGKEHYRYPSPNLQKTCKKMIEKGTDLVICQHTHCIGCYENYLYGIAVYGQGNFLYDNSDSEYWKTGLLLRVTFQESIRVEYIPILKTGNVVRLAEHEKAADILRQLDYRSEQILREGFIEQEYRKLAQEMLEGYLHVFYGSGKIFRLWNKLSGRRLLRRHYSDQALIKLRNYVECEAHRELIISCLKTDKD